MLQLRHIGGARVNGGTYWNFSTGERINIEGSGILPGGSSTTYYKANPTVILLAGPILGLVYAAFLPFIGIAMSLQMVAAKTAGSISGNTAEMASFGWRPLESYLTGRRQKRAAKESNSENDSSS